MDAIVSGLKVATLVDNGLTHNFVSGWTTWGLHHKVECDESLFKVVNSIVKPVVEVIHSTPLRVGNWLGVLDLTVVPMEDQSVVLGQDFLRLTRVVLAPHESCFLFEDRTKTCGVPMVMRKTFGWVSHMPSLALLKVEGDISHIVTLLQDKTISHWKYLGIVVGVLQAKSILQR